MIFEVLNETTLLVELSFEDMKKHQITYETLDCDNTAIKKLLKAVKASDSFNTSEKITIEALPINNGGCFFIITFSPKKKLQYKTRRNKDSCFFETDTLDDLLDFVSAIKKNHQKNRKCEIYKMNDVFYMKIPEASNNIYTTMGEFGQISNAKPERISEYGERLGFVML
jgi:negative regulator of genetic competence, sporulation and motility